MRECVSFEGCEPFKENLFIKKGSNQLKPRRFFPKLEVLINPLRLTRLKQKNIIQCSDDIIMFRYTCSNYGMFHQMRVDCGKEFNPTLGMKKIYSNLRSRQDISCYRQTQSKQVIFFL